MMQIASDTGIVVIVPAGDRGCDIDANLTEEQGDVIMVAGAMPNGNAQRWWTSNYTTTNTGGPYGGTGISTSTWGSVVTTGGNANLTKVAIDIPGPEDDTELLTTDQKRRSYTNDFGNNVIDGGSIAAAAQVAPLAKAYCSDAYFGCAADNIQIHGGVGFTWEYDCHLYFKRAKSSETLLGDPAHHRELVAQRIGL